MIELVREMTYQLDIDGPAQDVDTSVQSPLQYWQMTRATLTGPRIKATSCLTGNDWFQSLGDGYGRPHVRIPFRTDDGALLLLEYRVSCRPRMHSTPPSNTTGARSGQISTCEWQYGSTPPTLPMAG